MLWPPGGGRQLLGSAQLKFPAFRRVPATYADVLAIWRREMQGRTPNEEKLTEDEIARRKLGPRGIPGGEDTAENDTATEKEFAKGRRIRRPRCVGGEWAAIAAVPGSGWLHEGRETTF